jgi:hypothetical protein
MTNEKKTRPQRLANIVEISRAGEKVVGQIDRHTGEIIGEKPAVKTSEKKKANEASEK